MTTVSNYRTAIYNYFIDMYTRINPTCNDMRQLERCTADCRNALLKCHGIDADISITETHNIVINTYVIVDLERATWFKLNYYN